MTGNPLPSKSSTSPDRSMTVSGPVPTIAPAGNALPKSSVSAPGDSDAMRFPSAGTPSYSRTGPSAASAAGAPVRVRVPVIVSPALFTLSGDP
jgi:hypothetical protein